MEFWSHVAFAADGTTVGLGRVAIDSVVAGLERGQSWQGVKESLRLDAADIVAALAATALGPEGSLGPPLLQAKPGRPKLLTALSERELVGAGVPGDRSTRLALSAGLLQVHDFWDASHAAAQAADDLGERETSAYWHGIAHRREPDAGNAAYWFRRVGRHPIFDSLAHQAGDILRSDVDPASLELFDSPGGWQPSALIELVSRAKPGTPAETLGRRLQRLEMKLLLRASWQAACQG